MVLHGLNFVRSPFLQIVTFDRVSFPQKLSFMQGRYN